MRLILLPILACLAAPPAMAEIYKCRLPNGTTEISNAPCPSGSGTLTVRPDESVSEANRRQAERDVERMRDYVERREASQRAEKTIERQETASPRQTASPAPRAYGDPDACLRELEQQVLEATQRASLEAECRRLVRPPATTAPQPVYVVPHHAPPPIPNYRPEPPPKPAPAAPTTVICPPSSKNCR